MKTFSILSVVFALGAAFFWGWSTRVKVPVLKSGCGTLFSVMEDGSKVIGEGPFYAALKNIARLNVVAAVCAAASAFTQTVTLFGSK